MGLALYEDRGLFGINALLHSILPGVFPRCYFVGEDDECDTQPIQLVKEREYKLGDTSTTVPDFVDMLYELKANNDIGIPDEVLDLMIENPKEAIAALSV